MPSITITVTAAEATRLQAFATAGGFPDIKTMVIRTVVQALEQYEMSQNALSYLAGYTPVAPT
jgi:hypothetical protein